MAKDKNKNHVTNYAAPGAKVGLQADDVVITGGLFIGMGSRGTGGKSGRADVDALIADAAARGGTVNVARGNDTVAFQAGQVFGHAFGEDDDE